MSSNTKIVVLRSKELVYALVLLVVSVLIIMVAVSLFIPSKDSASSVPSQNAEETPEQIPSQTPSQSAPKTSPSNSTTTGTSSGTSNSTTGGTSNGNTTGTSGETSDKNSNRNSDKTPSTSTSTTQDAYVPGIYSSTLLLGNMNVELQIAVDKNHINSITLTNLDESVTTLYPLMRPTLSELAAVILSEQSIENISYSSENRYTSMLLMQAITEALDKAAASENADRPDTGTIIY
ncbi:MAG: hypothetical protein K2N95_16690 [Lachnospiraceae bacterium]|nr:hypothetical protein [Lachnospiraceae bacterium]